MAGNVDVRLNRFDLRRLSIRHATRTIEKVVNEVYVLAKLEARGPYSTGATAVSITKSIHVEGSTVNGTVRANTPWADMAHDGTRPHIIRPRGPGYPLRFYWRKVGHTVTPMYVRHPGMKGKRFLAGPMERVGRRNRFIVVTYS